MQQTASELPPVEPPTTLGPAPDGTDEPVTVPDCALAKGCYVEGDSTRLQTALLQSWCVEWAEAGHGFCYLDPTGAAPIDLLARLPEDRLEDVVWIEFSRAPYTDSDLPDRHVRIDPYEVPEPDATFWGFDPIGLRCNAVLELAREQADDYTWNVARIISAVLPPVLAGDVDTDGPERPVEALARALSRMHRFGDIDSELECLGLPRAGPAARQLRAARLHSRDDFRAAKRLLTGHRNGHHGHPVRGPTSYDVGRALAEDHIVLVTAAIPQARQRWVRQPRELGARLFVAAIICRLLAAGNHATDPDRMFPVVVDGVRPFVADDGELLATLLEYAEFTPLAPVVGGPPVPGLVDRFEATVVDHTASRVAVPDPDLAIDPEGLLMEAFQADPGRPDYWDDQTTQVDPRVNTTPGEPPHGYLATTAAVGDEERPQAHAYQLSAPPEVRHDEASVTDAIDRSLERHGIEMP